LRLLPTAGYPVIKVFAKPNHSVCVNMILLDGRGQCTTLSAFVRVLYLAYLHTAAL